MKLDQYIELSGDVAQFAMSCGVTPDAVRLWLSGKRVPRPEYMQRIIGATKGAVTPNDFHDAYIEAHARKKGKRNV